eukprot:c16348_g1_i1 orf=413-1345(+)
MTKLQTMISRLCCFFSVGKTAGNVTKVSSAPNGDSQRVSRNDAKVVDESRKVVTTESKPGKVPIQGAVLVELFTSQGCSSCPEADLLISKLGRRDANDATTHAPTSVATDVPVVVLAYHVDYWDYLGWKDPFANSLCGVRQRAYVQALQQDSIYTPEVVIQGHAHCIGSNAEAVFSLIEAASRFPASDIRASFSRPLPSVLEVSLSANLKFRVDGCSLDMMVAIFESGHVTDCSKGENRGRVLTNDFVVRCLEKACTLRDWSTKKSVKGEAKLGLWEGYSKAKCGMVVFFQNSSTMEVYGAQHIELPKDA